MRFSASFLFAVAAMVPASFAAVSITVPAAGASVPASGFSVTWIESGDAPSIVDINTYTLYLYTGPNSAPVVVGAALSSGASPTPETITIEVNPALGGEAVNAYFLAMVSTAAGGTVTNYSKRFSITGMTGTFSPPLGAITSTDGPPDINNIAAAAGAQGVSVADGIWGTPYNLQSGPTRYAPMQQVPGTKITATNTSPLYPTSAVQFASTALPMQTSIMTTVTQPQTFVVSSHPNTASPASMPVDDMQRFLNRWKD